MRAYAGPVQVLTWSGQQHGSRCWQVNDGRMSGPPRPTWDLAGSGPGSQTRRMIQVSKPFSKLDVSSHSQACVQHMCGGSEKGQEDSPCLCRVRLRREASASLSQRCVLTMRDQPKTKTKTETTS